MFKKIVIDEDIEIENNDITTTLYWIIETHFRAKYKMNDDEYKQLQDIMYNEEISQKLENIINEIDESVHYIPELKERGLI